MAGSSEEASRVGSLSESRRRALEDVYRRVDARAADIAGGHGWWPCRRGCDHCCRHLAAPLPLTALEWEVLWEGIQRLPPEVRREVRARVEDMASRGATRPYTCPLLDTETGACRVYAHRPLTCRSYGFAAARDGGRWCQFITDLLAQHGEGDIIWANQDALEEAVAQLGGETSTFFEWFATHPDPVPERG